MPAEDGFWSKVEDNPYTAQCFSCEETIPPNTKFVTLRVNWEWLDHEVIICKACVDRWKKELEEPT